MTDKEKLKQLFDAALKSPEPAASGPLKRAFPPSPSSRPPAVHTDPMLKPVTTVVDPPDSSTADPGPTAPVPDNASSSHLGNLPDDPSPGNSRKRKSGKNRNHQGNLKGTYPLRFALELFEWIHNRKRPHKEASHFATDGTTAVSAQFPAR